MGMKLRTIRACRAVAAILLLALCLGFSGCASDELDAAPAGKLAAAVASLHIGRDAVVLVGAGDIAECAHLRPARATARLVAAVVAAAPKARVFTTGDHAYPDGTVWQFEHCYGPTWGRFNARTYPTPGNHDYHVPSAEAYFDYFIFFDRHPAVRPRGYYSYDVGAWHIVALNSITLDGPDSPQLAWLKNDLASAGTGCILAYWHHPLYSSGYHGSWPWGDEPDVELFWNILLRFGADIVVNGHDHIYERFAPMNADGEVVAHGIREFVVGTGGAELYWVLFRHPNSVYVNNETFGVLILILQPTGYRWAFLGADGVIYDRGRQSLDCAN